MVEPKNYGIKPLCESGKGKIISGAADFGAAARHGLGFHTRPDSTYVNTMFQIKNGWNC